MTTYIALFEYEQGTQGFSVVFPDFPGLVTAGGTYEETLQMAHEALAGHIEAMRDYGEQIPESRTIELIQETWEDWNNWKDNYSFFIVPIVAFSQNKRSKAINIELDESLLERIDMVTSNRSEFINRALECSFKE
ncbi:MAG: type II toxin-antitoxin system HicB family antitoxin [Candidatus Fibromonas sp.]|jgi:predicted RNase H-like HicB family nuclease|nr:type II toxin-antitoxin system HicB family antitoxin [Candidatus Fibromonas sp.]